MTNERSHILAQRRMEAVIALSFASAILLAASCKDAPEDDSPPLVPGDAGGPPVEYRSGTEDSGVRNDTQVLQILLTINDVEVKRARMAAAKAVLSSTRDFATVVATDHAAANDRVRAIGEKKGIVREPSATNTELESEASDIAEKLDRRSGSAFDRVYLESEITTHVKTMSLIDQNLKHIVLDPDLAQAVEEARTDSMHRERAQELWRALPRDASAPTSESISTSEVDSSSPDVNPPAAEAGVEID